jgi:hypothetical protein
LFQCSVVEVWNRTKKYLKEIQDIWFFNRIRICFINFYDLESRIKVVQVYLKFTKEDFGFLIFETRANYANKILIYDMRNLFKFKQ